MTYANKTIMAEEKSELEKAVKIITEKIDGIAKETETLKPLKEKLDALIAEPEEKESTSGTWEILKLFFASVLGAVGGILINHYVANSKDYGFLALTIFILLGFSFIFYVSVKMFPKRIRKRLAAYLKSE